MRDRIVSAITSRTSSATAALAYSSKRRGRVVALPLAACLVGNSVLAKAANELDLNRDTADQVTKRSRSTAPDRKTRLSIRLISKASGPRAAAPANGPSMPLKTSGSADRATQTRTQAAIDPFARFENLREKGLWLAIPGPSDTIDQDKGGARSALADIGIGYIGWTHNSFADNQLPNAARSSFANQLYMGQNPTFATANFMIVTYDLSRFGIADGQIAVGAEQQYWTWKRPGPDRVGLNTLAYYQTFLDRTLELKFGYLRNQNEFTGTLFGGISGSNMFALFQAGMSTNAAPTPALNLKYNFDDRWYNKVSVQRSISPDGPYAHVTENPSGVNWSTANAGILFIDEIGYKSKAAPGVPDTWLRAGAGFSNSRYKNVADPDRQRHSGNSFHYIAADRQLWQSDVQGAPSRGIYGGFSLMGAPPDLNRISQYYELRLYAKGPFDSRPSDLMALVATNTVWSKFAVDAAFAKGELVHRDTTAITGTYTAYLAPGIYASIGLSYIHNPTSITHTPQTEHALDLLVSTLIFF
ncbi:MULTISPECIES: carbohydrate porin [Bradyrhizobium]|uniref:Carbohydrate porin n=2 Tax=Bradyrhizobium quebecense TaxID=2748629 RepID=A0A973WTY0_9BRAD|nr:MULTISPECIES: carbohydrate porin [Bradyrhizobium]UFX44300.1 carbohydrate porin [Bradyrhizobium sp. 41S5]UGA44302.1 carbohydrate porin [Bradyrhizobium quebecense]UGY00527.1 carbohydrate porin [Bradyrhizobium quebecense]